MASGEHINTTEDRAVMHMALRAPIDQVLEIYEKHFCSYFVS